MLAASCGAAQAGNAPPMMTVPGALDVGPTGAATYAIPIATPPGTAGMTPSLSLNYSSQSGNGIVGLQWLLGGLPSINRCPRTLAQDGVHGGVNYDMNDRFCMGGQRLVLISGTYGASGSEYRTEIEGFTRVIAHGTAGNGPSWFEVHSKAGDTGEFGNTTDSRVLAVGTTTARVWAIDKLTDIKGNYWTASYTNDTVNGQYYPTRIDYTGNAAAGLATHNSIQFTYNTSRVDVVPTYQAGSREQITVVLTDIKTYTGATLVSDYQLAYRAGTSTVRSRLTSVSLCDASANCLPPTTFTWQGGTGTPTFTTVTTSPYTYSAGVGPHFTNGDYNGDGLPDLLTGGDWGSCGGQYALYTGSATGAFTGSMLGAFCYSGFYGYTFQAMDFDGDGLTDFAADYTVFGPGAITFYHSTGTSFTLVGPTFAASQPLIGDFDGDGRSDFYIASLGTFGPMYISNGNGTFTSQALSITATVAADFDGDGCSDLASTTTVTYRCNPAVASVAVPAAPSSATIGDFNGDGKMDIYGYLSTGTGFTAMGTTPASPQFVGDFDGDGKTDAVVPSGCNFYIYLSSGTSLINSATIANPSCYVAYAVGDWNGDGAADLWVGDLYTPTSYEIFLSNFSPELMTAVSNGIGATTTITYDRLNKNGSLYTKGSGASYPTQDLDGPSYVVSRIDSSNGMGGNFSATYAYSGGKADLAGRGFQGFSTIAATNLQTGIVQTTNYRTDFPYTGLIASQTRTLSGVTLSSSVNTYTASGSAPYVVALQQNVWSGNDVGPYALPTTTTTYTYDAYGNALTITANVSDGSSKTITNTFCNNTTGWMLGRLATTAVNRIVGSSNITHSTSYVYDGTCGALIRQTAEPGTNWALQTDYTLDAYGNRTAATTSGAGGGAVYGITTRTKSLTFDSLGMFATTTTDALLHTETWAYSAAFGVPTSHTTGNSVTTSWLYDSFGRLSKETRPNSNFSNYSYVYCSGVFGGFTACPTNGAYAFILASKRGPGALSPQNRPQTIVYYDSLNRVIASDVQAFNGTGWIRTSTTYDTSGNIYQTTRPYFVGNTPAYTTYSYDAQGRMTQAVMQLTSSTNATTTYTYQGLTSSITNPNFQTTTVVRNAQGQNASVTDALSHTTTYVYDAFDNLLTATDYVSNVTTNIFDLRSNKTSSTDPDMGHWTYAYDSLGELITQTDAKSQTTTLTYDKLRRVTQRVEADLTSTWTWDTATHGIGYLAVAAATGTAGPTGGYKRTMTYDIYSRPTGATVSDTAGTTSYPYATAYNSDGQIDTVSYPSGFVAKYLYTPLYLSQIKDNGSGAVLETVNTRDAELHLAQQTAGNSIVTTDTFNGYTGQLKNVRSGPGDIVAAFDYTYDPVGNLSYRSDNFQGVFEYYCYDALNRLTQYSIGTSVSSCTTSGYRTVGYDGVGNITSKTGVGTYAYPTPGSARPHAVSSITGTVNGVTNPTYTYDANGNLTAGAGRTVTPNTFNMAASIVQGSTTVSLFYNSEHSRVAQTTTGGSSTLYLNDPISGAMEEVVGNNWHDYVLLDGKFAAERACAGSSSTAPCTGTVTWTYFVTDHLGSVASATNSAGTVVERDAYDPWGKRRNLNGTDDTACTLTSLTTRGFTGHEHMPALCEINANARIYDPTLGRFMTADSFIRDAFAGQSLNRYSYVENGPLSGTDLSGNFCGPSIGGSGSCSEDMKLSPARQTQLSANLNIMAFMNYVHAEGGWSGPFWDARFASGMQFTAGFDLAAGQAARSDWLHRLSVVVTGPAGVGRANAVGFQNIEAPSDRALAVAAMNAANAALQKNGILGKTDPDLDHLLGLWSDTVQPIAKKYDTELLSDIYAMMDGWQVGSAYSDGERCSTGMRCGVSPFGGQVAGGFEWGYIHTHPNNLCCFSPGDWQAARNMWLGNGFGTAFVSLPNGQIWGLNALYNFDDNPYSVR